MIEKRNKSKDKKKENKKYPYRKLNRKNGWFILIIFLQCI